MCTRVWIVWTYIDFWSLNLQTKILKNIHVCRCFHHLLVSSTPFRDPDIELQEPTGLIQYQSSGCDSHYWSRLAQSRLCINQIVVCNTAILWFSTLYSIEKWSISENYKGNISHRWGNQSITLPSKDTADIKSWGRHRRGGTSSRLLGFKEKRSNFITVT